MAIATIDHLFQDFIGYTSSVILKLQEQGKLSLDDTLGKWLPDIAAEIPDGENLTIKELLNGTG